MEEESSLIKIRKEKLTKLIESGKIPYPNRFKTTHNSVQATELVEKLGKPPLEDIQSGKIKDKVSIAGRIRMIREHGKLAFITITTNSFNQPISSISNNFITKLLFQKERSISFKFN